MNLLEVAVRFWNYGATSDSWPQRELAEAELSSYHNQS